MAKNSLHVLGSIDMVKVNEDCIDYQEDVGIL